jgi:predicted NBD/HSP70 family sugar kinase
MSKDPRGNRSLIRAINRTSVLNIIKNQGPISRTEIAEETQLSAATITGIVGELIHKNLVYEKETGDSRGGRRPILVALNSKGGYSIGIKLSADHATAALIDLEAAIISKHTCPLEGSTVNDAVKCISEEVRYLLEKTEINTELLIGVGVGLAGVIDPRVGILKYSPIFGWKDVPLVEMLQAAIGVPVLIDNDVNTLTFTEKWFGAGRGIDNFLTVTVGRGVGLGIVVNGRIYRGWFGGAGEFGHTVLNPTGPACICGKKGCLETFVSDPALLRMASEAWREGDISKQVENVDALLTLAQEGDLGAIRVYERAGIALGQGLANLINLLNPELIIISGEGAIAGDLLFEPMNKSLNNHVMPVLAEHIQIRVDEWEDDAWARGAASLVLRRLFESPFYGEAVV